MRIHSMITGSLLVLGLMAIGQQAEACPKLDGHYTCTYDGSFGHKVFELDSRTTDERGSTVYVINGKKVYTDGQPQHTDSLPILEQWANNVDYTGTCEGEAIAVTGSADVKKNGQRADLQGTLTANEDGSLAVEFNVSMGFFSMPFSVPCTKR